MKALYLEKIKKFQFTLPCGERPEYKKELDKAYMISIHAPVWGATQEKRSVIFLWEISIHAPVWGATLIIPNIKDLENISIHAPVCGERPSDLLNSNNVLGISIHAPVWGATL